MADLNSIVITGHLTADACYRTLASGKNLLSFSVANNVGYGNYAKTNYYTVNLWGDRGGKIAQYLKKGQYVALVGEETLNEYDTKAGVHKQERLITTNSVQLLSSGKSAEKQEAMSDSDSKDMPSF